MGNVGIEISFMSGHDSAGSSHDHEVLVLFLFLFSISFILFVQVLLALDLLDSREIGFPSVMIMIGVWIMSEYPGQGRAKRVSHRRCFLSQDCWVFCLLWVAGF